MVRRKNRKDDDGIIIDIRSPLLKLDIKNTPINDVVNNILLLD